MENMHWWHWSKKYIFMIKLNTKIEVIRKHKAEEDAARKKKKFDTVCDLAVEKKQHRGSPRGNRLKTALYVCCSLIVITAFAIVVILYIRAERSGNRTTVKKADTGQQQTASENVLRSEPSEQKSELQVSSGRTVPQRKQIRQKKKKSAVRVRTVPAAAGHVSGRSLPPDVRAEMGL
jgi:cytoskeletal protein RodZ